MCVLSFGRADACCLAGLQIGRQVQFRLHRTKFYGSTLQMLDRGTDARVDLSILATISRCITRVYLQYLYQATQRA